MSNDPTFNPFGRAATADSSGSSFARFKRVKPEDGKPVVVTICPPMKSLIKDPNGENQPFHYSILNFVRAGDPADPKSMRLIPFLDIREEEWQGERSKRKKVIIKDDPLNALIAPIDARRKAVRANFEAAAKAANQPLDRDALARATKADDEFMQDHYSKGAFNFYAVEEDGTPVVLQLNVTLKKQVMEKRDEWQAQEGYSPFSVENAPFFVITKKGERFGDIAFSVTFKEEKLPNGSRVYVRRTMSPELIQRVFTTLPDFAEEDARLRFPREVLEEVARNANNPLKVRELVDKYRPKKTDKVVAPAAASTTPPAEFTPPVAADPQPVEPAEDDGSTMWTDEQPKQAVAEQKQARDEQTSAADEIAALKAKLAALTGGGAPAAKKVAAKPVAAKSEPSKAAAPRPTTPTIRPGETKDADMDALFAGE